MQQVHQYGEATGEHKIRFDEPPRNGQPSRDIAVPARGEIDAVHENVGIHESSGIVNKQRADAVHHN